MASWISWLAVGLMIAVLVYAVLSVYLKKPIGLYIAAAFHIALGILSLPSIGLYVLGIAILELIVGFIMTIKTTKTLKTS
ncbi:hypothetical protein B5M42_010035 [Paenibacillus athensensis]|uniref:hypothetical protein n=1 Tax=Paenibacillus athensensis TaxID=1967502 RepID=UPI00106F7671|nr:hypothetical protein [Paenibacillus athensensis]MCD1259177.1 hypothetical protein [Paenibacillus athensensis]